MDADASTQQKTLEEFLSSVEDAVSRGASPDPGPAIAEGDTYPAVHDFFLKRPALVAEWSASATDEERLRAAKNFISYKKDIFEPKGPELKQLHREKETPTGSVSPIREKAITDTGSGLLIHKKEREGAVLSDRAREAVQKFVKQLEEQKLYGPPEKIEEIVEQELNKPVYAQNDEETKTTLTARMREAFPQDRHAAETIAENVLDESREFIAEKQRETTIDIAAAKKIIEDETLVDGKTFVETLTKNSVGNNQPIQEQLNYAVDASRAATVVNALRVDVEGTQVGGILTRIPGVKEAAIEQAFANAWTRTILAENSIETLTTRFGAEVVRSKPFQDIIKSGTDVAQQRHAAGAIAGGLGKIAGDLRVSAKGPPSKEMLHYISALYEKQMQTKATAATSPAQFIITMWYIRSPDSFSASSAGAGLSGWILRLGAQKAAGAAVKGVGKAVVEKAAVSGGAAVIGGAAGTALGGPVGTIVGSVLLDKVFSFGGKILGGITGGFKFLASGAWLGGEDIPTSSMLTLGPLVIIIAIVCLPIIVMFLVITRNAAIITSYGIGQEPEGGPGTVDCQAKPDDPLCKVESCVPKKPGDCMWPTTGYITQGPFAQCVVGGVKQTSHDKMSAVDIGAAYNTPVIAVRGGEVVTWQSGCPDQPGGHSTSYGCNGGWGNHIDIEGGGYVLRYAHLALQSMSFTHLHMIVTQGQGIGRVDNNGNSTGNHLHFQVISGQGGVLSILPLSAADAARVNGCIGSFAVGCPIICPSVRASIQ